MQSGYLRLFHPLESDYVNIIIEKRVVSKYFFAIGKQIFEKDVHKISKAHHQSEKHVSPKKGKN